MKNILKMTVSIYGFFVSALSFYLINWHDINKNNQNIFLLVSACFFALLAIIITVLEIKDDRKQKINLLKIEWNNYVNSSPDFEILNFPTWLINMSDKYPEWYIRYKDVVPASEISESLLSGKNLKG
jgi:hypothetical protein